MKRLTVEEWQSEYEPVMDDDGEDYAFVKIGDRQSIDWYLERKLLWTRLDSDEDEIYIPGLHYPKHPVYVTTNHPYESDDIYVANRIEVRLEDIQDLELHADIALSNAIDDGNLDRIIEELETVLKIVRRYL